MKLMQNIGVCLQARNYRWHFPDEDDDGTKQDEIPHDQHSDAASLENVSARMFQLNHLTFFTFFS